MNEAQKFWAETSALEPFSKAKGRTGSLELDARAWGANAARAVKAFQDERGRDHDHPAGILPMSGKGVEVAEKTNAASHVSAFMREMRLVQLGLRAERERTVRWFTWDAEGITDFL